MYCKHCGKEIADDSKFCRYCGNPQDSINEDKPTEQIVSKDNQSESPTIKVEVVTHKNSSEDRVKKVTLTVIKEIGLIVLFVAIAFIAKVSTFQTINSQEIPEISQEDQKAFNDAIFKKQHPNGVPPTTIQDMISGNWDNYDKQKYPVIYDVSFGVEAAKYLKWGDFKYDNEATTLSDLEDLNEFRKYRLQYHAEETAGNVFWIALIGLILLRYFILFFIWLFKSDSN